MSGLPAPSSALLRHEHPIEPCRAHCGIRVLVARSPGNSVHIRSCGRVAGECGLDDAINFENETRTWIDDVKKLTVDRVY